MRQYRKLLILLSADMQHGEALARGALLARASGAELVVQLFCDTQRSAQGLHDPQLIDQVERKMRETRQHWLETTLSDLGRQGLTASGTVVRGHPVREAMLAAIMEVEPDLTLKSVHHESALRRLFITPDDWYLARFSPSPLLIVAEAQARLPNHVIVAVDPVSQRSESNLTDRIVATALTYALQAGADLHMAYVSQPITDLLADAGLVGGVAAPELLNQVEEARRGQFSVLADRHGVPRERQHFLHGRVDAALNALADQVGAGLIVVGSNHRKGLDRFLLGSTTEDLLAHARHDVLVVKPEDFDERLLEMSGLGGTSTQA